MIKANELRIGNWVFSKNKATDESFGMQIVSGIIKGVELSVIHFKNGFHAGQHLCDPIPLTPEILEKCGFKYDNVNGQKYYWNVNLPLLQIRRNNDDEEGERTYLLWYSWNKTEGLVSQAEVKWVHKLQNLYFALTGKELDVNNI